MHALPANSGSNVVDIQICIKTFCKHRKFPELCNFSQPNYAFLLILGCCCHAAVLIDFAFLPYTNFVCNIGVAHVGLKDHSAAGDLPVIILEIRIF